MLAASMIPRKFNSDRVPTWQPLVPTWQPIPEKDKKKHQCVLHGQRMEPIFNRFF